MADRLQILTDTYRAYVDTYRDAAGNLPPMMDLKRVHTAKVVEAAREIAAGEGFDAHTALVCEAAALLHDTGRYEQLRRYNTFRDADSADHAVFSRDIVAEKGWLETWPEKDAILTAVLVHNRRDIPEEATRDPLTFTASKTVRDADKLDIFRVLEDQVASGGWRKDPVVFGKLQVEAPPSPEVVRCIREGRPVDYQAITCLSDFVLIQIGWMISDLNYATSRRLCAARGHLAFRRKFLHELSSDPAIDELCDLVKEGL